MKESIEDMDIRFLAFQRHTTYTHVLSAAFM